MSAAYYLQRRAAREVECASVRHRPGRAAQLKGARENLNGAMVGKRDALRLAEQGCAAAGRLAEGTGVIEEAIAVPARRQEPRIDAQIERADRLIDEAAVGDKSDLPRCR